MDQDIPPMLSSSPPPLERGFADLEDDEETPTGFAFGRLDFEDDSELAATSRVSVKSKNSPARTEASKSQIGDDANTIGSAADFEHVTYSATKSGDRIFGVSENRTSTAIHEVVEEIKEMKESATNEYSTTAESQPQQLQTEIVPASAEDLPRSELRPESGIVEASEVESSEFIRSDPELSQSLCHSLQESGFTFVKDDTEVDSGWVEAVDCDIPNLDVQSPSTVQLDTLPEINSAQSQTAQMDSDFAFEMMHDKPDDSTDFAVADISALNQGDVDDDWAEFSDFSTAPTDSKTGDTAEEFDDFQSVSVPKDLKLNEVAVPFDAVLQNVFGAALLLDDSTVVNDVPVLSTITAPSGEKVWTALEHLDETNALKFQWASSSSRQKMLHTLNLSPSSVFSMQKKEPVALHSNNINDNNGILQPVKVERNANQTQQSGNEAPVSENPGERTRNLEFASSDSSVPQHRFPDLSQPAHPNVRKADISFIGSGIPVSTPLVPGEIVKSSKMTNGVVKPVPPKLLDEEAQDIVKRFRNLDFMQSTTLIKTASKPSSFQKF